VIEGNVVLLEDEAAVALATVVAGLGLTQVGWAVSHGDRTNKISNEEVIRGAGLQLLYGKGFVTCTVHPYGAGSTIEAFQLSDQCLKLQKKGRLRAPPAGEPTSKTGVEGVVIVEGSETNVVDNDFFLLNVPIKSHDSVLTTDFPVANRDVPTAMSDLKVHLINNSKKKFVDRLSDFHLLVFLAQQTSYFDAAEISNICELVRLHEAIPEGYQLLISNMAGL